MFACGARSGTFRLFSFSLSLSLSSSLLHPLPLHHHLFLLLLSFFSSSLCLVYIHLIYRTDTTAVVEIFARPPPNTRLCGPEPLQTLSPKQTFPTTFVPASVNHLLGAAPSWASHLHDFNLNCFALALYVSNPENRDRSRMADPTTPLLYRLHYQPPSCSSLFARSLTICPGRTSRLEKKPCCVCCREARSVNC